MANSLTLPLAFWHRDNLRFPHHVTALTVSETHGIVTGSSTSELIFWMHDGPGFAPRLIATPSINHECRQLILLSAPPHPERTDSIYAISLHADNRIRVWDFRDGRCVAVTPTTMFSDGFVIAGIVAVPKRLVAIAGSEKSVHILDAWTMTRMCSYRTNGDLEDIRSECSGTKSRLAALHGEGFVTVWDFHDTGAITAPADFNFVRPTAKLTTVVEETPTKVAISKDFAFIAVAYERMFHIDNRDDIYIKSEEVIIEVVFTTEEIIVFLKDMKVMKTSMQALQLLVRPTSQRNLKSEVVIVQCELFALQSPIDYSRIHIIEERLYYYHRGVIKKVDLRDLNASQETFDMHADAANRSLLADRQLHEVFHSNERISCSHLVIEYDWPLYILGTTLGRVFIIPLSSTHSPTCLESDEEDEITCLAFTNDRLVSCFREGHIDIWSLSHDDVTACDMRTRRLSSDSGNVRPPKPRSFSTSGETSENTHMQLITSFKVAHGPIVAIVLPEIMEGSPEQRTDCSWLETHECWRQMIIGQLEDGLLLIISISRKDLYCMLTGVGDVITKVTVNIPMEYLLVETEDETVYVYNTMNQQLERVMYNITSGEYIGMKSRKNPEITEMVRTYPQQVLETMLSLRQSGTREDVIWGECKLIGKKQFPILCLNMEQVVMSVIKSVRITDAAKFAISILNRWEHPQTLEERQLQTQLQVLCDAKRLSISSLIGIFGVEESVSLPFPHTTLIPWEVSPQLTSLTSISLLSILSVCMRYFSEMRPALQKCMDFHAFGLVEVYPNFTPHLISLLSYKALEGNPAAYAFLKLITSKGVSEHFLAYWVSFVPLGANRTKAVFPLEEKKETIAPAVAIAVVVLSLASLQRPFPEFSAESIVKYLSLMLNSGKATYIKAAGLVLTDGIKTWREHISKESVSRVTLALLSVLHSGQPSVQANASTALMQIGRTDGPLFCEILKREVAKLTIGREYPPTVLSVLEGFIFKHATSLLFILPAVADVVLRSLDQKDIFLRKICVGKATSTLEQMVKRLPMVAFDPTFQRLAIGTPEGKVFIYNLSSAALWKTLDAHVGPSTALAFKSGGTVLVSYCMQESRLCFWAVRTSFFGLGSDSIVPAKTLSLEPIQPVVKSTSQLLEVVRIAWDNAQFALTREDKQVYFFD